MTTPPNQPPATTNRPPTCHSFSKLMSLKLDGALDEQKSSAVEAHVGGCPVCATVWSAMLEADVLMWKWVAEPLPVPANFQQKVMLKIAAQSVVEYGPSIEWTPQTANVTRPLTGPIPTIAGPLTVQMQSWQRRASGYLRGLAFAGFAVAGSIGLMLVLLLTGLIQFEGPVATLAAGLRSYVGATDTWLRSISVGMGAGAYAAVGLVMLLLALVGWQIVAQYQRSIADGRGHTGYLEALS